MRDGDDACLGALYRQPGGRGCRNAIFDFQEAYQAVSILKAPVWLRPFHLHFLDTDRIARDVAYQTIILGELIKLGKEIIQGPGLR
jgi:hypothetical protein